MIIFIGMIMSVIYLSAIDYLSDTQGFLYKKWDMDTCTPADYTIQIRISDDQYEEYKSMLDGGEKRKIDEIITEKLEEEVKGLLEKYHSDNCNPEDAC